MSSVWQQFLALFGIEILGGCNVEYFDGYFADLILFGEGLIIESGIIVGKAAIIDVEEEQLEDTKGTLPHSYVVPNSNIFHRILT